MPDAQEATREQPQNTQPQNAQPIEFTATPEFQAAVVGANRLLDYATSKGLLPKAGSATSKDEEALVHDVIYAQAATSQRLPLKAVIDFWMAYGRLANLVRPVTAASIEACRNASLMGMQILAAFLVAAIIVFSIFLFMSNATLTDTNDLIERQNAAALKLWSDVQMLRASANSERADIPAGPGRQAEALIAARVFEEMVEFSRNSAWLLQSASRLNGWFTPSWMKLNIEDVTFNGTNPKKMDHLNVPPEISTVDEIKAEAVNQIKAYQSIRDFALGLYKIDTLIYSSLSAYFLPTVYALLGAFLYGFRFYSRLIRHQQYLPSAANSARYFIAAIAGLVVGLFGSLLPKNTSLPPLLIAFLVGYAVEAFFSRLDDLIRKVKDNVAVAPARPSDAAHATDDDGQGRASIHVFTGRTPNGEPGASWDPARPAARRPAGSGQAQARKSPAPGTA